MKLSEHLTRSEFEHSPTAIDRGINNSMTEQHLANAIVLAKQIFEPIRKYRGKAIKVNSGYRSAQLNRSVGGSKTSQHCTGEAIDLPLTADEFHYIKDNLEFDQLIAEFPKNGTPQWVHVSYRNNKNQRRQVLVAKKVNGKIKYLPYKGVQDLF